MIFSHPGTILSLHWLSQVDIKIQVNDFKHSSCYLESNKQCDSLDAVVPAVHIIPHEQVVGVRGAASDPEQFHQIVELSVHIAAHRDGAFHFLHVRLLREDLLCLERRRETVRNSNVNLHSNRRSYMRNLDLIYVRRLTGKSLK